VDNLEYSISVYIADDQNPLRRAVETLPLPDQWRLVELIVQNLPCHRFLLCHPEKEEADYALDFSGSKWLDYIPSLRYRLEVSGKPDITAVSGKPDITADTSTARIFWLILVHLSRRMSPGRRPSRSAASPANREAVVLRRGWHSMELATFEATLLDRIDGERSIREILRILSGEGERLSAAEQFFRRMAEWDHFLYRIP
jgi:hypothetical protein